MGFIAIESNAVRKIVSERSCNQLIMKKVKYLLMY